MGALNAIGTFCWRPSVDRWVWDDALFGLHGYASGDVAPTRALLVAHAHPQDRDRLAEALGELALHQRPYCARHRIVTADGHTRAVVVAGGTRAGGSDTGDDAGPELVGYVIPLDGDSGAPPLTGSALPGPADVVIPVPRGRDGTGRAEPVVAGEAAGEATVPAVRSGEPEPPDHARHAELLRRAHDTLVAGLDLTPEAAATLVAWLANAHEMPPVMVAESLAGLDRDAAGRPDLAALLVVLGGGPGT